MAASSNRNEEEEEWNKCVNNFQGAASFQGRFAYLLMSIHFANPRILNSLFSVDLFPYLWANMVYGLTVMIYSRQSLKTISPFNRLMFGTMGSFMFNYTSLIWWTRLVNLLSERPYILTLMGFVTGRIMMVHLLAFLYHIDSRTRIPGVSVPRDAVFEGMYSRSE